MNYHGGPAEQQLFTKLVQELKNFRIRNPHVTNEQMLVSFLAFCRSAARQLGWSDAELINIATITWSQHAAAEQKTTSE